MKNTIKNFLFLTITVLLTIPVYGQLDINFEGEELKTAPNIFDYSKRFLPSIEVKLWGSVKNPGIYKIQDGINLLELLSYSGGLTETADLEDIRIVRFKNDTLGVKEDEIIVIDYDDLFSEDFIKSADMKKTILKNGDVIVAPAASYWYQSIAPVTTILSLLTSLGTLIYLILRNN
jgi:hypothetical protein